MISSPGTDERYHKCLATLRPRGQDHVLRWWECLTSQDRERLLEDIEFLPWDDLDKLIPSHILAKPNPPPSVELEPAPIFPHAPSPDWKTLYQRAVAAGRERLHGGTVAALTVAGGQGTRLGFAGPKGAVPVTPVVGKTFFQLLGETILAAGRRYGVSIPWYIMTSPANHHQTVEHLARHDYFGLPRREVFLFSQGMLPAFDFTGRLLMEKRHRVALAPDGHGGVLRALPRSGALVDMRTRGVEVVSYFQVDNPLVNPFDPLFIGLHTLTESEMSTKIARKADDLECVGNVCLCNGSLSVIEYTEFPETHARQRNADGSRTFDAGNLGIHLLDVAFLGRFSGRRFQLPYRRAEKVVAFVDERGDAVNPTVPNAVKLESFIFDALPWAKNPLVLEVARAEEFSPVKNLTGVDSLESAKGDQVRRAARWLDAAGVPVPRGTDGEPRCTVEIAPLFALDAEELAKKADRVPTINLGTSIFIK